MVKHTALAAEHEALGAHLTDFAGWSMPLRYGSELAEHRAVRSAAGLFDLSHMGEIQVSGPGAVELLEATLVGAFAAMKVGKAKYSLCCNEAGGIVDDLIVYRLADDDFLIVPNASNVAAVHAALQQHADQFDVAVDNQTETTSLIALQGPAAATILNTQLDDAGRDAVEALGYYAVLRAEVAGHPVLVARTGYTGEDGFELIGPGDTATDLWQTLLQAGEQHGLVPAGLAARDSLRLEAGMPLHGNELSDTIDPFMVGLGRVVALKKESFTGREALAEIKELEADPQRAAQAGRRHLIGLKGQGRRAARPGAAVLAGGDQVGEVTSGLPSPTLGYPIALALVDIAHTDDESLDVDIRGAAHPFDVVDLPFYSRS